MSWTIKSHFFKIVNHNQVKSMSHKYINYIKKGKTPCNGSLYHYIVLASLKTLGRMMVILLDICLHSDPRGSSPIAHVRLMFHQETGFHRTLYRDMETLYEATLCFMTRNKDGAFWLKSFFSAKPQARSGDHPPQLFCSVTCCDFRGQEADGCCYPPLSRVKATEGALTLK